MIKNIFLFAVLISCCSYGQNYYEVDTTFPVNDLMSDLKIIEDNTDAITANDILKDSTLSFKNRAQFEKILKSNTAYWGKLELITNKHLNGWKLHLEDRFIGPPAWIKSNGTVDIYGYVNEKLIFHKKSGVEYPKKDRDTKANWVLNQVGLDDLPVQKPVTLIIRVKGNQLGYPAYFNATLRSPKQPYYHHIFQFNNSFNIFMFGVTFIILLYHLLQYFYLKERVFLWFSIWLMFCTLTQAMTIGIIIGSITNFRFILWYLIANGMFYMFWFFGRSFIDSKNKYPTLDKFILGLSVLLIVEILITTIYVLSYDAKPLFLSIGIHSIVIAVFSFCSFILSVIILFKKDTLTKYFGFGSIIASGCMIIGSLWSMGVFGLSKIVIDPYVTGMFLQIVIYSFGIAYRQQQLSLKNQEEKLKAQKTYAEMQRIKDLDDIKTRFFANISHEFRTPLSLISGPINRAQNKNNDDDDIILSKKNYEIIKNNTSRLHNLVDQLLDLSKIESGQVHLSLKQGEIIQFLRSIVFSFESMSERENISLNTSFPEEFERAFYDKDKLEKIVTNILSNAIKYTSENGSVTVTVAYNDTHITIKVSDTGKGIAKEELPRIFDRFYRVEGSEKKGSGIGLALTKELVDLHNGSISVDSTKGKGTTFKIRLPITLSNLPEAISVISKSELIDTKELDVTVNELDEQSEVITKTIRELPIALIVEDNNDLQHYISEIISKSYTVIIAKDGLQGERMAFEHVPDIIISDVMMPKKDGYELCHILKTNTKTSHIPIIMLTAKAGQSNRIEGLTQGADAFMTKPFDDKELLLQMKNLIDSRKHLWEHFKALDMLLVDDIDVTSIDDKFLQDVFKTIKTNLANDQLSVEHIAREVGFSRSQLHRKLKAISGKSANQLITEIRLNEAHRMLKSKSGSVSEIAYAVGYSNLSYFTKSFKERFGELPSKV
ncbi:ATP-binding protein [uncultured Psychroserpens sp.]|uniref:ATP-binding protein n=1 Tax=uncultured Psychroserpens sp. TaxID=255436 RepID=UPI00261FF955|nr:ATP-binding protein [uncultured Psychroserpens sp.]